MNVYILHHTESLQDYNYHKLYTDLDKLTEDMHGMIEEAKKEINEDYHDIYTDDESEFYYEHRDGTAKIYWTEHEV